MMLTFSPFLSVYTYVYIYIYIYMYVASLPSAICLRGAFGFPWVDFGFPLVSLGSGCPRTLSRRLGRPWEALLDCG